MKKCSIPFQVLVSILVYKLATEIEIKNKCLEIILFLFLANVNSDHLNFKKNNNNNTRKFGTAWLIYTRTQYMLDRMRR